MNIDYTLLSTLNLIFLFQGVLLGTLLILLNKKGGRKTLFLGIFIILFGLTYIPDIIDELGLLAYYPKLEFLPLDFTWSIFPMLYLYVKDISVFSSPKKYWILVPGIIEFLQGIGMLFLDLDSIIEYSDSFLYNLIPITGVLFSFILVFNIYLLSKKHIKVLNNQYSSIEYKEFKWVKYFSIAILSYFIFTFIFLISIVIFFDIDETDNNLFIIAISIINFLFIFFASFRGILQQNVSLLIPEKKIEVKDIQNIEQPPKKIQKEISPSDLETVDKIQAIVVENLLYKKVDLTIVDVSKMMDAHPKTISSLLNTVLNLNFNQFINNYRIDAAKDLLLENKTNNYTIEGIAYEVGFKSKSSFYTAFKKNTNMTPVQYKNTNIQ